MNGELIAQNPPPYIRLHEGRGEEFIVFCEHMTCLNRYLGGSNVFTVDTRETPFWAVESPEEILSLIEEAYR